jgi:hypothetical protein
MKLGIAKKQKYRRVKPKMFKMDYDPTTDSFLLRFKTVRIHYVFELSRHDTMKLRGFVDRVLERETPIDSTPEEKLMLPELKGEV